MITSDPLTLIGSRSNETSEELPLTVGRLIVWLWLDWPLWEHWFHSWRYDYQIFTFFMKRALDHKKGKRSWWKRTSIGVDGVKQSKHRAWSKYSYQLARPAKEEFQDKWPVRFISTNHWSKRNGRVPARGPYSKRGGRSNASSVNAFQLISFSRKLPARIITVKFARPTLRIISTFMILGHCQIIVPVQKVWCRRSRSSGDNQSHCARVQEGIDGRCWIGTGVLTGRDPKEVADRMLRS